MQGLALLHAVTDATRAAILEALRSGERSVGELVAATRSEQSNVSHHLRGLRDMGLVAARRQGRQRLYELSHPRVHQLLDKLDLVGQELQRITFYTRLEMPLDPAFQGYG